MPNWQKKAQASPPPCPAPTSEPTDLELDEMWTFVGRRKNKVWLWLAVERATRRIVAWVLGCRGAATARRLWQALPARYQHHTTYYTDEWEAYAKVLPRAAHRPSVKGSGATSIVESLNCSLRQRCGVLVRKSCSFSKLLSMHQVRIQLCIDAHNLSLTKT
ncbi:MAG: IS1 family transposase [Hymenobacter sp.]|nr:MAG: IS1 family transposase [Hymenobacter sp.]